MRVDVTVNKTKLSISVGTGQQSFKWLATVIQERLRQFNLMRKNLEPETFIVTEIRNHENQLINPKDKLFEHTTPAGLSVIAIVSTAFPIDDWENPKFNDWMQVAYLHTETNRNWAKEMDAWRENLQGIKENATDIFGQSNTEAKRMNINNTLLASKAVPHTARLIKIGFDFTEADVELAFNLDWQIMTWKWLSASSSSTPFTEVIRSKLGDVLKGNYSVICNIFAHYAGVAKVGQRYGMTIEELGHFFHFIRFINWKNEEEIIENIVQTTSVVNQKEESNNNGEKKGSTSSSSSGRWLLITRAHFTEILTYVAMQLNPGATPDIAIKEFLEGKASEFWDLITTKYLQYTSPEPTLRKSFFEYYYLLRNIFHERSTIDSTFGARLALPDFIKLLKDSTLVDFENENFCITCFLQAQLNPTVQYELEYLVFIEFIEAISRLALKAIEAYSGLTDGKRIRMAFNMISELSSSADAK